MYVDELSREECLRVLAHAPVARLACASENQPYVVPVYLAYCQSADGDDYLYGFATMGRKVTWMRANPLVCVEVDEISCRSQWVSVIAFGHFMEIPNIHEQVCGRAPDRSSLAAQNHGVVPPLEPENEQLFAHQLLEARAMWWEPASTLRAGIENPGRPNHILPVFYKIRLADVTGYRARREEVAEASQPHRPAADNRKRVGWLSRTLNHWRQTASRGTVQLGRNCRNAQAADVLR